ncbi:MAG: hypothetical protein AUG82_01525 [Ktedonobacter sp. 13_1_20CM_4_53_11]|nr:MAG: hypothetical protein AUG82_01525 [Ktedonobacter sp. 13_1_20CM_4_53_11]
MTGMEESSCRSAPVTGERMPGMASPTAIASTLNAKAACNTAARTAHRPDELRKRMIRESLPDVIDVVVCLFEESSHVVVIDSVVDDIAFTPRFDKEGNSTALSEQGRA